MHRSRLISLSAPGYMPNGHEYDGDEEPVEVGDLLTTAGVFLDLNLFVE